MLEFIAYMVIICLTVVIGGFLAKLISDVLWYRWR